MVAGQALTLPLSIADLETSDPISFVEDPLPPGATFSPGTGTLSWPSAGPPGTYQISVSVDDMQSKPRRFRQTIVVVPPGGKAGRDEDPILPAIKGLYALAGQELRFAVPVTDPEGDPFTVTPDGDSYAFAHGATHDPATGLVRWTPAAGDIGSRTFRFEIVQGSFRRVLEVRVFVDYPLFALAGVP